MIRARTDRAKRSRSGVALTAAVAVALAVSGCTSTQPTPALTPSEPAPVTLSFAEADVAAVAEVIGHLGQAVVLTEMVLVQPDLDEDVVAFAGSILDGQASDSSEFSDLLSAWGRADATASGSGTVTETDLEALAGATGEAAARVYLELITVQHANVVAAASPLAGSATSPEAAALATELIANLEAESAWAAELLASS